MTCSRAQVLISSVFLYMPHAVLNNGITGTSKIGTHRYCRTNTYFPTQCVTMWPTGEYSRSTDGTPINLVRIVYFTGCNQIRRPIDHRLPVEESLGTNATFKRSSVKWLLSQNDTSKIGVVFVTYLGFIELTNNLRPPPVTKDRGKLQRRKQA